MKKLTYIFLFLLAVAFTGCRSHKQIASGTADNLGAKAQYDAVVDNAFSFDALQAKVKYSLGSRSLSGKMTIEQGQRLCLTMTVMGAEIARVEANQESVYIVDKFDKVYAQLSIADAAAKLGLEEEARYEALEALLLGRIFLPGKGYASKSDFQKLTWKAGEENQSVTGTFEGKQYQLNYTLNADNQLQQTLVDVPARDAKFVWRYDGYQPVEGKGNVPTTEKLSAEGTKNNLSLNFTLSNPQINKKGVAPFNPDGYRRVSFEELLTILKNLK